MISASDADGFYDTITYSLDNDYGGTFVIDQSTGALMRTTDTSITPDAVSIVVQLRAILGAYEIANHCEIIFASKK